MDNILLLISLGLLAVAFIAVIGFMIFTPSVTPEQMSFYPYPSESTLPEEE